MAPFLLKHQTLLAAFNENVDNHLTFQHQHSQVCHRDLSFPCIKQL